MYNVYNTCYYISCDIKSECGDKSSLSKNDA